MSGARLTTPGCPGTGVAPGSGAGRAPGRVASSTTAATVCTPPTVNAASAQARKPRPMSPGFATTALTTAPACAVNPEPGALPIEHAPCGCDRARGACGSVEANDRVNQGTAPGSAHRRVGDSTT